MANTLTLTQVPFPVSPVAKVQQTTFVNDYLLLSPPNCTELDRKLVQLIGLMYQLNVVRGVDYRTNMRQLMADAQAYTGAISNFNLDAAQAVIEWSNGTRQDATIPNNLPALRAQHPSVLSGRNAQDMDRMIALLRVRLGQ
jgi:hypothetical protein